MDSRAYGGVPGIKNPFAAIAKGSVAKKKAKSKKGKGKGKKANPFK